MLTYITYMVDTLRERSQNSISVAYGRTPTYGSLTCNQVQLYRLLIWHSIIKLEKMMDC